MVSIFARINLAKTGAAPLLEIAITIGERSTIDGIVKVQRAGASTTFTGMFFSFAAAYTAAFTVSSLVAAITNAAPVN